MRLRAGERLGPYEIVGLLGAGGMGEVYKAVDRRLNRTVAIKVLPDDVAADPRRRERFRREARAISSLTHPHICALYDIGDAGAHEFLVMEHVPGETLAQRLLRGPLPLRDVLRVAAQLADALDAAHRAGLVHRDLKPANVMLTTGDAKVLDFGVAKWRDTAEDAVTAGESPTVHPTLTVVGSAPGTLQYMAPEQLEGKTADQRSDLFALGAVIYEMTTGRKAFEGDASTLRAAILTAEPPPVTNLRAEAPPLLARLITKCLAKDPADRWQTASDVKEALGWISDSEPVQSTALKSTFARSTPRALWIGLVFFAVALGIMAAAVVVRRGRESSAPTDSVMRFVVVLPPESGSLGTPIVSPDGRKVVFTARAADGTTGLWVRSFDSLEPRRIADVREGAFPFWSPDATWVAFFASGQLQRVQSAGGPSQVICAAPDGRGGTWSSDGVILFAPSAAGGLYRVPAGGGAAIAVTTLESAPAQRSHTFPQFLTGSHQFVYSVYFAVEKQAPVVRMASLDSPADAVTLTESSLGRAWVSAGYLVYERGNGTYLAQRLDAEHRRVLGEPVTLVDHLADGDVEGDVALSASNTGVLAYRTAVTKSIQLTWFGRNGKRLGTIGPSLVANDFSLSDDETRVALTRIDPQNSTRDIWNLDVPRGVLSRVTTSGSAQRPRWSPGGDQIAFGSNAKRTGGMDIDITSRDGAGGERPLVVSAHQIKTPEDWSNDGRWLLFASFEGVTKTVINLWAFSTSSGSAVPYLVTDFNKFEARFSPDARWVAYESPLSGRLEVYVDSFPRASARTQVSSDGGEEPKWRRDGRELFYLGANGMLMAVPVKTAGTFEVGPPSALFEIPAASRELDTTFEVSRDGQRFLVGDVLPGITQSPITIVFNWLADLPGRSDSR